MVGNKTKIPVKSIKRNTRREDKYNLTHIILVIYFCICHSRSFSHYLNQQRCQL